jgi:hypothetical protein
MKKIVFAIAILLCSAFANASDINIVLCKEKNYDCQVIPLQDVKKVEKLTSGEILRVTFSYGDILDIKILGKTFEIKKNKKKK